MSSSACIPLAGTQTCSGFKGAAVSTDSYLVGLFPFLENVTDVASFDSQLRHYISNGYVQQKYKDLFGCTKINPHNTTDLYARYSTSFVCNAIIQNSVTPCKLSANESAPLCADSCADFALSEQSIVTSPSLCGSDSNNTIAELRADFTNCALPADSITGACVPGYVNQPDNCGYGSNLAGLCSYCHGSTTNSTDSCCVFSDTTTQCKGVVLPVFSSMPPLFSTTISHPATATATHQTTSTAGAGAAGITGNSSLTGGQIAGIVVGTVIGVPLLVLLLILCCVFTKRSLDKRRKSPEQRANARRMRRQTSIAENEKNDTLNQPSPPYVDQPKRATSALKGQINPIPGSRITRMEALTASNVPTSDTTDIASSPDSRREHPSMTGMVRPPKRRKSLPRVVGGSSPESGAYTSAGEETHGDSERLSSFKDYYSNEDIHTGDLVSVLWGYQPRAVDEFQLARGQMLKVVGIWDDGWATGVRVSQRAEDYITPRGSGRDSVVSTDSGHDSSSGNGDIKAFPLVCVCVPSQWKTIILLDDTPDPSSPE